MACVSKIGSLYEMVTKNVIVSTTNTVFGINPRAWIALPCEGLILLKIRQVVPTAGSALPVQIAVPANSTKGRRIKRGLFKTSSGRTINADINGAFNIIRKSEKESFDVTMLLKGRGFWWNPVRISV